MVDGNKPKQQRDKPVDKQTKLKPDEVPNTKIPVVVQQELGQTAHRFRDKSFFTRRQISKAVRKKKQKIQRKSRQINRLVAKGKR